MPGGGITSRNIDRLIKMTGVTEIHMGAHITEESGMQYRNNDTFMGGVLRKPEYAISVTGVEKVVGLKQIIG